MKVLWLCNIMLPAVAEQLHREASNKEGWLSGLFRAVLTGDEVRAEMAVAFPVEQPDALGEQGKCVLNLYGKQVTCYGFSEDTVHPEHYDNTLEESMAAIVTDFGPDIIHCFGAEYPHTLAMCRAVPDKKKLLIGIQGMCSACGEVYFAGLPEKVINKVTFRDWLKKDGLKQQKAKFDQRGIHEREALSLAGNITGRTAWDRNQAASCNSEAHYYSMNETLRACFYEDTWKPESCEKHSVFLSQGDYPIKGFHDAIEAMAILIKKYPDAKLYVAGNTIAGYGSIKEKIKISGYGKYLHDLMKQNQLEEKIVFLGKMTAEEMKKQYLNSNVFLCCSNIENSPNSLGEAMLLGVPCVTSDVGGITSIFDAGKDGVMYKGFVKEEPEAAGVLPKRIADAIATLWEDEEAMKAFGKNARAHALRTHDKESNQRRLVEIYADMLCI